MKNRGSIPILTNIVGVHLRHIHTKFEAAVREKKSKTKNVHANDDDGHMVIARVTLTR